ncbi:MAG: hypothetical protein K8R85_01125 [Bacteroidetes bacterium]|nr:hypothetical protein [Bacteroidota bacterium]
MIKHIENKNIDKKKWDALIDKSANSCIFVYSWYLDVVCENWSALVLNDYEAVFPIQSKSKYKINYLYQPFFTRYFGLFSKTEPNIKLTTDFLKAIPEKYKYIEFCLHETNKFDLPDYSKVERKYQLLDLNAPYQALHKGYSENAKRNIKKAIKAEFAIKHTVAHEIVVDLFKSTKGQELEVFKANDYKILLNLMRLLVKQNKAETIAVYDKEDKLCAAAFFMKTTNRLVFLKSGVTDHGKVNGAMHFLFNTFIQQYAGTEKILDFGGSSVETVARFYKNFGAKDCVYLQLKKNSLSRLVKWISNKA